MLEHETNEVSVWMETLVRHISMAYGNTYCKNSKCNNDRPKQEFFLAIMMVLQLAICKESNSVEFIAGEAFDGR